MSTQLLENQPVAEASAAATAPLAGSAAVGYLLLALSVLCNGARYHLDKAALRTCSPAMLTVLAPAAACLIFLLVGWICRLTGRPLLQLEQTTPRALLALIRKSAPLLLGAAAAGALGGYLNTKSVAQFGPQITAFLGNLTFVFLILGGLVGGERLRVSELAAIVVALAGAFAFSYRGGEFRWDAVGLMAGACFFTAIKQLMVKRTSDRQPLPVVMTTLLLLITLWAAAGVLAAGRFEIPPLPGLLLAGAGALLGSVLGMALLYAGYLRVGVARGAPLDALRPVAVLLLALLLGQAAPPLLQLVGGAAIIIGSMALAWLGLRRQRTPAATSKTAPPAGAAAPPLIGGES